MAPHVSEVMEIVYRRNTRITRAGHGHWGRWSVMSLMWQLLNPTSTFNILPQVDRSTVWCSPMSGCQQTNSCT